jgi:hypothetical protein
MRAFDRAILPADCRRASASQHPLPRRPLPAGLLRQPSTSLPSPKALHWFELAPFYAEVERVLRPGGVLALWTYGVLQAAYERLGRNFIGRRCTHICLPNARWSRATIAVCHFRTRNWRHRLFRCWSSGPCGSSSRLHSQLGRRARATSNKTASIQPHSSRRSARRLG